MHASGRTIDYARSARDRGVREFAATDHCPTDVGFGKEHRMTVSQFAQYIEDVAEARRNVPEVTILFGIEADYYLGCEPFLAGFCEQHRFDIVLGSVHFIDYWSTDPSRRGLSGGRNPDDVWSDYYRMTGRLADTGLYDVVTHMDLPKRFGNAISVNRLREYALPALDRIAAAGMAIEINTSGWTHSIDEAYPGPHVLAWAAERGIGLVFGSDAHSPHRVGDGFDLALQWAHDAGFRTYRQYRGRSWTAQPLPVSVGSG